MNEIEQNHKTPKLINLITILDKKEREYIQQLPTKSLAKKIISILELINAVDDNITFTRNNFEKIRKAAVSKGGLLLNSYRKEIYKKAFFLNDDEILFFYYDENNFTKKSLTTKEFYNLLNTGESEKGETLQLKKRTSKTDERIIEVDVKRTIANRYFENNQEELNIMKQNLTKFLKLFFHLNPQYGYYQGFHEIGLYIYLIYYNYEHLAIQMLQRFVEFFLKDYMVEINNPIENNPQNIHKNDNNFQFETVFKVLNDVNAQNDKKFWKFIQDNTMNCETVNTLPWIITLFTHDVGDMRLQLRILDYILFSHPNVVYHMASCVIYFELLCFLDYFE